MNRIGYTWGLQFMTENATTLKYARNNFLDLLTCVFTSIHIRRIAWHVTNSSFGLRDADLGTEQRSLGCAQRKYLW